MFVRHCMEWTNYSTTRAGVNSGIEWELSSIPDSIPGIGLGIGIEKKELELNWNWQKMPGIDKGIDFFYPCLFFKRY